MAINSVVTKIQEQGNGTKVAFDFPFAIYEATDLDVYKVTRSTLALNTKLTYGADYTVAFTAGIENSGTVTFTTAPSALQDSLIVSDIPETQAVSLPVNGRFSEKQIESMGDRATRLIQQIKEEVDRAIKVNLPFAITGTLLDPDPGMVIGWNSTGDGIQNYTPGATGPTGPQGIAGSTGPTGPAGSPPTSGTFTNASLTAGVLTITHTLGLSAPYAVVVAVFDNTGKQIIPDEVTGTANNVAVDLTSYGTLTGTWGYRYY
jgi:hypothetical protein